MLPLQYYNITSPYREMHSQPHTEGWKKEALISLHHTTGKLQKGKVKVSQWHVCVCSAREPGRETFAVGTIVDVIWKN